MSAVIGYVDDDLSYARALRKELDKRDATLVHFSNSQTLMRSLEDETEVFDMLLVDLEMADTAGVVWSHAGIQVVCAVRNLIGEDEMKICVLTRQDPGFLDRSTRVNGADAFIQKGRRMDRLADRIVEMVAEKRARGRGDRSVRQGRRISP